MTAGMREELELFLKFLLNNAGKYRTVEEAQKAFCLSRESPCSKFGGPVGLCDELYEGQPCPIYEFFEKNRKEKAF